MFGRPRCREWTPLATQQLRLRSLIQIVGYNIRPPEWCVAPCSYYLTLHHTTMSAPFYTSERICSPHPKWKEIDSEITQRMSATNVVIRVWSHIANDDRSPARDSVIQTWGVYLSGLRYIGANLASNFNSDCFKSNTLVFQMLGGYFCSYKSLKLDIIPPENEQEHGSHSSDSSGRTNLSKIALDSKAILNNKVKESRSVSPNKRSRRDEFEYSKSHSPVDRGFHQHFPGLRNSTSLNITHRDRRSEEKTDPSNIYEHSPENLDVKEFTSSDINCDSKSKNESQDLCTKIDLSETAENYDLRNEADGVPKYRYLALNFLKSEIRPSYDATKLQKLHLLQYSIKKRQEAVQEIKERIYKISALSERWSGFEDEGRLKGKRGRNLFSPDDLEGLSSKSSSQSDLSSNSRVRDNRPVSNGPRLGLKLNDLLSFKAKPSPFQRAEHIRLTKQLEVLRFKRIILADERDSKLANIRRLKERHAKLAEENQDVGTELMQNYHALSRRSDAMREMRQSHSAMRELAARSHAALASRRFELLQQLHEIFYIHQVDDITWSICGIPLAICGDTERGGALAAQAAGLAAQAAGLAATVLGQPLRYALTLKGDCSTVLDVTPDLPDPNIPLYPRGGDVTLFRYGMFLLNKCIGQLCFGRGLPIADIRPTLYNLQRLLTSHSHVPTVYNLQQLQTSYNYLSDSSRLYGLRWLADTHCPSWTQSLRSLVASERGKYRPFNRFKDAVDGQSPQSAMTKRHRHSRSVGSYHDDQDLLRLDASTTSIMGSESNIYNMKLSQNDSEPSKLKKQASDSEILRLTSPELKVIFTIGDDAMLQDLESKLVRISTNNDDEITCSTCLDENVKRICSEITDFCSKDSLEAELCAKEIHEGFDVAKYMATKRDSVCVSENDAKGCANWESNGDGDLDCAKNVTDVIVIENSAAILDTGQESQNDSDN